MDPGGIEIFESDLEKFRGKLTAENHTLKRALTDPRLFSGIGNAYSDEILHRARLSPIALTASLSEEEIRTLYEATRSVLQEWVKRLRTEAFPEKVTAFRPEMAVHGKFGQPCPVCGTTVQRIVYAENEVNYCPGCQTGGKMLADRSLSRLLKSDWPRTVEEAEAAKRAAPAR
jgi:formamidopyrimidine-DNA glycosylase